MGNENVACLARIVLPTVLYRGSDIGKPKDRGAPATGLFVLWAPILPKTESAPQPEGGSPPSTAGSVDAQVSGIGSISLSFVDGTGFLQNVAAGQNPWRDIAQQLSDKKKGKSTQSHAQKMCEGTEYRLWLVAHPHPDRAHALLKHLTDLQAKARDKKDGKPQSDAKPQRSPAPAPAAQEPAAKEGGGPGSDFSTVKKLDVKLEAAGEKGKEYFPVFVPADPSYHWPGGSPHYDRWLLYHDMPHGVLTKVREQVRKAASRLAPLRYPTGAGQRPYSQNDENDGHRGFFDEHMMAAVHAFQLDVVAGKAFLLDDGPRNPAKSTDESFRYLLGQDVTLTKATDDPTDSTPTAPPQTGAGERTRPTTVALESPFKEGDFFPGVLDDVTAQAIEEWKAKGLRRHGAILVFMGTGTWAQPAQAFAVWAWDHLVKALQCPYGVAVGSTYRPFSTTPGSGQTATSNHALGVATDFSCEFQEAYVESTTTRKARFPVVFEARWELDADVALAGHEKKRVDLEKKLAAAKDKGDIAKYQKELDRTNEAITKEQNVIYQKVADPTVLKDKLKNDFNLRFCLYGHSTFDFLTEKDVAAALKRLLGAQEKTAASAQGTDADQKAGAPTSTGFSLVDRYEKTLWSSFGARLDAQQQKIAEALITPAVKRFKEAAEELIRAAGEEHSVLKKSRFVTDFIREAVRQFNADSWKVDGGDSLAAVTAPADAKDPVVKEKYSSLEKTAKCWLNLSRLAHLLDMHRISGREGDFKRMTGNPEAKKATTSVFKIEGVLFSKSQKHPQAPAEEESAEEAGSAEGSTEVAAPAQSARKPDPGNDRSISADLRRLVQAIEKTVAEVPDWKIGARVNRGSKGKFEEKSIPVKSFTKKLLDFMWEWPPPDVTAESALPNGVRFMGLDVSVQLSGDKNTRKAQEDFVERAFSKGQGKIVTCGSNLISELKPGLVLTGEDLTKKLTATKFNVPLETLAAKGDDKAAPKAPQAAKKKPKASSSKDPAGWTVLVRPVLVPDGDDVFMGQFVMPLPGSPKGFEWWHYEHGSRLDSNSTKYWVDQAKDIGYSRDVLIAPKMPPAKPSGFVVRGTGYKTKVGRYAIPPAPANEFREIEGG